MYLSGTNHFCYAAVAQGRLAGLLLLLLITVSSTGQQPKDSVAVLKNVDVNSIKTVNPYASPSPVQVLSGSTLRQLNAPSVGDAARYFSGVLVKDYGGIGGLKTISVRSLGASAVGVVYDGLPVSDLQTGQLDLSRYSTTFVSSLAIQQGNSWQSLAPARTYAPAASLIINSNTFNTVSLQPPSWQAGIRAGSFNLWQPFAGVRIPVKKNMLVAINAEAVYSKGNYPYSIDNGNLSSHAKRDNSDLRSVQGEISLIKQFTDSSILQIKTGSFNSERGLPGAIVFFSQRSVQRLGNADLFTQARYERRIKTTNILLSAKYSRSYSRYVDPDFLNNQGGLDDRYTQQEGYFSAAASRRLGNHWALSAAADAALNTLAANKPRFAAPSRFSNWEHLGLQYHRNWWKLDADLLYTGIHDQTKNGVAAENRNKFTPFAAVSFHFTDQSPWLLRLFYKASYRMPTFNDLYYNFISRNSLLPEFARQYNAGATYTKLLKKATLNRLSISADVYDNEIRDKIIAVPNQNLFVWTMLNLGKVRISGIDINAEFNGRIGSVLGWFSRIAYTWQHAEDITDKNSSVYGNRLPYTPDHSGSGLLSFNYGKWAGGYSALFSVTRYTLGGNNPANELAGWLTHDVFAARTFSLCKIAINLKGELNNISNQHFDVVRYYPMPGRSFKISLLFNQL